MPRNLSDQALWGQDNAPAVVDGYGPIPASLAQHLVQDAVADKKSLAPRRRLYGVAVPVFPEGAGRIHRIQGPDVSYAVL